MGGIVEEIPLVSHLTINPGDILTIDNHPPNKLFKWKKHLLDFLLWNVAFVGLLLLAGPLAHYLSHTVPAVKTRDIPSDTFSEERARDYLNHLTQYGSRVSNTRGNFQARQYLISQLYRIHSTSKRHLRFQFDLQNFTDSRQEQLQNILVRVFNANQTSSNTPSLMLTAHYDSVEFSPGSCDDGSGVVVLLELFSNLVHDATVTLATMDLILLFTDGEESGLHGAQAFQARHTWWLDARYLISLDSTSCRELASLVQTTRSQLVLDYRGVARPRVNMLFAHLARQVPFESDYTALTASQSLLGYDFGFVLNGYTYHTSLDQPWRVKQGILQDLGDNLGPLVRYLLSRPLPTFEDTADTDPLIYFDILGRYLLVYPLSTSILIQRILVASIVLVGIGLIAFDHVWHRRRTSSCDDHQCIYFHFESPFFLRCASIILYFISNCLSAIAGLTFSLGLTWILSKFRPFVWYGNPTLAMFLLICPCWIGFLLIGWLFHLLHGVILRRASKLKKQKHSNGFHGNFEQHFSILLIYSLLMIVAIFPADRLSYMILVWSIFICPIYLLLLVIDLISHWKQTSRRSPWFYLPLLVSLLPLTHTFATVTWFLRLLIPQFFLFDLIVFPSAGHLIICSVVIVPTLFLPLNLISVVQRTGYFGRVLLILLTTLAGIGLVAMTRQPFDNNRPKMFYAKHISKATFALDNLSKAPSIVPLRSQSASITVLTQNEQTLSQTLDQFSRISGHALQNKRCYRSTICTFDDTFNRKLAVERIRIESTKDSMSYIIRIEHVPSSHIRTSLTPDTTFTVRNAFTIPRTETIMDVHFNASLFPVRIDIDIRRCDIADSPFLILFTRVMPNRVLQGAGHCRTIDDHATLIIYSQK